MPLPPRTPPTMPASPYVDSVGAAAFLLNAPQTLANWRINGEGPPFSKVGKRVLYRVSDFLAFVEARKVGSTAQLAYSGKPRGRPPKAGRPAPIREAHERAQDHQPPPNPDWIRDREGEAAAKQNPTQQHIA
jgi:hypothetical protein